MTFGVECSEVRVFACAKKMSLGVLLTVSKFVTKMAPVCTVIAGCSGVGSVDCFGTDSCPEGTET